MENRREKMPHEDSGRVYWRRDPHAYDRKRRADMAAWVERAEQGDVWEKTFFKHFVRPTFGPRLYEDPEERVIPVYSFIDREGDEIRASLDLRDYEWWEWEFQHFSRGPDDVWYPVGGWLRQPLSHLSAFREVLGYIAEAAAIATTEPKRPVCGFDGGGALAEKVGAYLIPMRGTVYVMFERVHVHSKRHDPKPSPLFCAVDDLEKLIAAADVLRESADQLLHDRKARGLPLPASVEPREEIKIFWPRCSVARV